MNHPNRQQDTEGMAITALAAASKTPFRTAFLATLGVGLARLVIVLGFLAGCTFLALVYGMVTK